MRTPPGAHKHITLHVQDQTSTQYEVRLIIDEYLAKGTLVILTPTGEVVQSFRMRRVKKGKNGTELTCIIRGATTTLTMEEDPHAPQLRVAAALFFPIFNATYHLSQAEHQHLVQWINTLDIGTLA